MKHLDKILFAAALTGTTTLHAADVTWDSTSGNGTLQSAGGTWDTSNSLWTTDNGATNVTWPGASGTAVFSATGSGNTTITLNNSGAAINAAGVKFLRTGYTLASQTAADALDFGSTQGSIDSSALGTTGNTGNVATISATLAGTAGVTVAANGNATDYNGGSSSGRLNITGNNSATLTGGITITSGVVQFANQNAAGTNAITLNGGGIVRVNSGAGGGDQTLNNAISLGSNGGTLRAWGSTTLTLSGLVNGSGKLTTTDTGTVKLQNYAGTGAINVGNGTLEFTQTGLSLSQLITSYQTSPSTSNSGGKILVSGGGTFTTTNTNNQVNYTVTNGSTLNFKDKDGFYRTVTVDATSTALKTNGSSTSGYGVNYVVSGNGVAATTGVQMLSGGNFLGSVSVNTAATTIRASGATAATWYGWDTNAVHLQTNAAASGTVVDSLVNLNAGGYGFVINATGGANTATGDIVINGALTGALNGNNNRFWINKSGVTGSVLLNGTGTTSSFTQIDAGTLLIGNNSALGTGTLVAGGNATLASYGAARSLSNNVFISDNKTLTVNTAAGDVALSGAITGVASNAAVPGTGNGLTKSGNGQLTLSGANTYTGATNVNAGTLLVNGTSTGTGLVTVGSTGTLGGTGSIAANVSVSGVLAPGASIESLATGAVNFTTGSTFAYELTTNTVNGDLLLANGDLSMAGTVNLTFTDLATITPVANNTILTLINYSGVWNNGLFTYAGNTLADDSIFTHNGQQWRIDYNSTTDGVNFAGETGYSNFVNITAIPEPSTATLLGGLGLLALLRRRRA